LFDGEYGQKTVSQFRYDIWSCSPLWWLCYDRECLYCLQVFQRDLRCVF